MSATILNSLAVKRFCSILEIIMASDTCTALVARGVNSIRVVRLFVSNMHMLKHPVLSGLSDHAGMLHGIFFAGTGVSLASRTLLRVSGAFTCPGGLSASSLLCRATPQLSLGRSRIGDFNHVCGLSTKFNAWLGLSPPVQEGPQPL